MAVKLIPLAKLNTLTLVDTVFGGTNRELHMLTVAWFEANDGSQFGGCFTVGQKGTLRKTFCKLAGIEIERVPTMEDGKQKKTKKGKGVTHEKTPTADQANAALVKLGVHMSTVTDRVEAGASDGESVLIFTRNGSAS